METAFPTLGRAEEFYSVIDPAAPLGVLFAGRERNEPGHRAQTVRDHHLFHYVLEGRGRFGVGTRSWDLAPGSGFLLAPGVSGWYAADRRDPWVYTWVGFRGQTADPWLTSVGVNADHPVLEAAFDPVLADRMLGLTRILEAQEPGYSLAAEGQMLLVLADWARLNGARARVDLAAQTGRLGWAEAAAEFLETNFHRNIGVDDAAAYVGFHPSHLGRLFRARYGTTVHAWLVKTRLERAKHLLLTTDRPVGEIARSVGFRSYPAFEKRFRAETRFNPTDYRRMRFFA